MKKIFVLTVFAIITIACGGADNGNSNNSSSKPVAEAKPEIDAKRIWKVNCIACHGLYGNQELNGAADLQKIDTPLEERIAIITNGKQGEKGIMTAFGSILSPEEIEAVAKHSMTFNKDL